MIQYIGSDLNVSRTKEIVELGRFLGVSCIMLSLSFLVVSAVYFFVGTLNSIIDTRSLIETTCRFNGTMLQAEYNCMGEGCGTCYKWYISTSHDTVDTVTVLPCQYSKVSAMRAVELFNASTIKTCYYHDSDPLRVYYTNQVDPMHVWMPSGFGMAWLTLLIVGIIILVSVHGWLRITMYVSGKTREMIMYLPKENIN